MPNYTLTHSQDVQGWASFYSYFPEYIMGMNQYLYTFKNGDLYRHNTNTLRNNYYALIFLVNQIIFYTIHKLFTKT